MASSLALRAAHLVNKVANPLRSAAAAPARVRSFSTESDQVTTYQDQDRSVDVDRGSDRSVSRRRDFGPAPALFSDAFDPFSPTRSLSQVLNLMDQLIENPFAAATRGVGAGTARGWDVREDEKALHIKMDMPGVGKEGVKVYVEQNTLVIKGEAEEEADDEEPARRYASRLDLPPNTYKFDEIKAELKNGVLKITIPKVKEEERENVYQVTVQ
ncbi:hypothetical protein RJ640_012843 [Escallonia rubra]|uniref:SHSP domain-containing protein n=1 Tax=Escallonia rubra TaxID=112253 RepID=A0AA88QMG9_9ASTE|nr:hypothetical protein RJ640_012843 [Escallonia rubra]